jgi:hypothetical protein
MDDTQKPDAAGPESPTGDARPPARERFQFSLRNLMILTTVGAVLAACVSMLELPDIAKFIFLAYLLFLATYIFLRLPFLLRGILKKTPEWERLRREREELERLIREKRSEHDSEKHEGP